MYNIHVNDPDDSDAAVFKSTIEALGLQIYSTVRILECRTGPYISDDCSLGCVMNVIGSVEIREEITFRKMDMIN